MARNGASTANRLQGKSLWCGSDEKVEKKQTQSKVYVMENNLRGAAEAALEMGFYVFPLQERGKAPVTKHGHLDASPLAAQLDSWWDATPNANVGIACGASNLCVLDFDEGEPPADLPKTYTVRTSRGVHKYYWGSFPDTKLYDESGKKIGELKSLGGYVLGAGSVHPSGKIYTVVDDFPVADAPVEIIQRLTKKSETTSKPPSLTGDKIPYGQHDIELTRIAGKLRRDGLEEEAIYDALVEVCEKRCVSYGPDYKSMCRKIAKSVCKYPAGEPVTVTIDHKVPGSGPANDIVTQSQPASTSNAPNFNSLVTKEALAQSTTSWIDQHAPTFADLKDENIVWLVDRMFMETGLHLLCARQGSFKTILDNFLADALANELVKQYCGRKTIDEAIEVIIVDKENPKSIAITNARGTSIFGNKNVRIIGEWEEFEGGGFSSFDDPRLIEHAMRAKAAGRKVFFIFDSLSQFLEGANENDNSEMTVVLNKAKHLSRISAGVLVLHHSDKYGNSGWRGCTAIVAVPDMCFGLERENEKVTFKELRFRPTATYEIELELSFNSNDGLRLDPHYYYKTVFDSANESSGARKPSRSLVQTSAEDQEFIALAKAAIEVGAAAGKPAPTQNALANEIGIQSHKVRQRVLCAGTPRNPRPWRTERSNRNSLVFLPLDSAAKNDSKELVKKL